MMNAEQCIVEHAPEELDFSQWESLVDMLAEMYDAASGVIVQYRHDTFNVVRTSSNEDNFLESSSQWPWDMKSFCRRIVETNDKLYVKNAGSDKDWFDAPPVCAGPVRSYLGYPLYWPDGSLFGSFCVIDTKPTDYSDALIDMLGQLKSIVEKELRHVHELREIKELLAQKIDIQRLVKVEQKQLSVVKKSLSLQESINTATLASLFDSVIRLNSQGKILACNPVTEAIFGYTEQELIGRHIAMLIGQEWEHSLDIRSIGKREGQETQINATRKDLSTFPARLVVSEIHVDNEVQLIALFCDISEKVKNEAVLKHMALYDQLTHCANRNLLIERSEYELVKARRNSTEFSLAYVDLNGFKPVNDTFGHQVGDQVLKTIANRLNEVVRSHDLVARVGGDEFVVLFDSKICSKQIKQKLACTFDTPIPYENEHINISASIGLSSYPKDGETVEQLLEVADSNMYKDKYRSRAVNH
ncbi:diguanylate cyclase [Alteromonadaceae bacterium M269]|nr:diguanylate cyclase [Alteromonadaceae bacterium M269]